MVMRRKWDTSMKLWIEQRSKLKIASNMSRVDMKGYEKSSISGGNYNFLSLFMRPYFLILSKLSLVLNFIIILVLMILLLVVESFLWFNTIIDFIMPQILMWMPRWRWDYIWQMIECIHLFRIGLRLIAIWKDSRERKECLKSITTRDKKQASKWK